MKSDCFSIKYRRYEHIWRSVTVWFSVEIEDNELLVFARLNAGHGCFYPLSKPCLLPFSDVTHSAKIHSAIVSFSFQCLVCRALIAFESDATGPFPLCVLCCESVPAFFDSLSVRLMFQKVDMCAPCNAVFTEPPHQVSARCIHGTQGPDGITQFSAAHSGGWQHQEKQNTYLYCSSSCLSIKN